MLAAWVLIRLNKLLTCLDGVTMQLLLSEFSFTCSLAELQLPDNVAYQKPSVKVNSIRMLVTDATSHNLVHVLGC